MTVTALAREYPKNTVPIVMPVMQGIGVTVTATGRGHPKPAVPTVTAVPQRAVTRRRKEDDGFCPMQSCVSRNAKRAALRLANATTSGRKKPTKATQISTWDVSSNRWHFFLFIDGRLFLLFSDNSPCTSFAHFYLF